MATKNKVIEQFTLEDVVRIFEENHKNFTEELRVIKYMRDEWGRANNLVIQVEGFLARAIDNSRYADVTEEETKLLEEIREYLYS